MLIYLLLEQVKCFVVPKLFMWVFRNWSFSISYGLINKTLLFKRHQKFVWFWKLNQLEKLFYLLWYAKSTN